MPLNDAVPSSAADVFKRNAEDADKLLNDTGNVTTRTGKILPSWDEITQSHAAWNNRGAWVTATAYAVNDIWGSAGVWYAVLTPYTSGTTAADDIAGPNVAVLNGNFGSAATKNTDELVTPINSVAGIAGFTGTKDDQQISLKGWHPDSDVGGGILYWDSSKLKSEHNGDTVFSPTVPFSSTDLEYKGGVGETDISGAGCWVVTTSRNSVALQQEITDIQQRLIEIPDEVDAAGTANAKVLEHNNDATAHPSLSAFITSEADRAENAADAAALSSGIYETTAAGLLATVDGDWFYVVSTDPLISFDLYKNNSGVADYTKSFTSARGVSDSDNAIIRNNGSITSIIGSESPESAGASGASASLYMFYRPAKSEATLMSMKFNVKTTGVLTFHVFERSGDTYTSVYSINKTISTIGVVTLSSSDLGIERLKKDQYLGGYFQDNLISYSAGAGPVYFSKPAFNGTDFTETVDNLQTVNLDLQFTINEAPIMSETLDSIDELENSVDSIIFDKSYVLDGGIVEFTQINGKDDTPVSNPASFGLGTLINYPDSAEDGGVVKRFEIYAQKIGSVTIGAYTFNSTSGVFTRHISETLSVETGLNIFDVNIEIEKGWYLGVETHTASLIGSVSTSAGHGDTYITSETGSSIANGSLNSTVLFEYRFLSRLDKEYQDVDQDWDGKGLVTFGDSITWYDGNVFSSTHIESGQIAVGYQSYARERLGCVIDNQGLSGRTMPEIWNQAVSLYDFSSTFAVSITSGTNDHRRAVAVGTVGEIGGVFDNSTFTGALQKSIEFIYAANKKTKIFLMTPNRGYFFESGTADVPGPYKGEEVTSREYVDAIKSVGELYGLPVLDWYDELGINKLTYSEILGDNPAVFSAYSVHPTNYGFSRMGSSFVSFLRNS